MLNNRQWNRNWIEETKVGEIVVYNVKGKDIPIVHRVVRKFGAGWASLPMAEHAVEKFAC